MIGSCAQEFPVGDEEKGLPVEEYEAYLQRNFADNISRMKQWYPGTAPMKAAKSGATIASDIMLLGSIKLAQKCVQYGRRAYVWLMNKENETERSHRAGSPHCAEKPYEKDDEVFILGNDSHMFTEEDKERIVYLYLRRERKAASRSRCGWDS
ncbi:hypothetical protein [Lachnoclostridium sp. Marseille-P6806]|uniref:hypothetical protein n=1 Tax=Lachnoclostridium sp. Marseille-P6806 TaxID=2364793 RepID=UPI0010317B7F|nr:hypothetical protein [Lachnoclostridium sp. Marseille-P6806]